MIGLLDELRGSMGCRPRVALREVADLATPATAGWLRPFVLLPDDWRSWDGIERRAVLAHELAHIIRGDYAAGLLARLAVALHSYHPMVRWMAGRLLVQHELAADALGARFAGGRSTYLVALSRLALRQDGRSPCWPARAFLPARGTLIRRIAMLRDETGGKACDRPWSGAHRLLTMAVLLGLTICVATLRGPALGADDDPPTVAAATAKPSAPRAEEPPIELRFVPDGMDGVIMVRPAAAIRRAGMDWLAPIISESLSFASELSKQLKVDMSAPGFLKLDAKDIESVFGGLRFGRTVKDGQTKLHMIEFGRVVTIRTVAPFDWLAYLRQWRLGFEEVRDGGRTFHKVTGPLAEMIGPQPGVYLHDDRTLVLGNLSTLRALAARKDPAAPAYLRGADWERASRGLLAYAITNHDGTFPKRYDLGRPDDALFLSLFPGVDHWVTTIDDADSIVVHASAACRDRDASEAIARAVESVRNRGLEEIDHPGPGEPTAGPHLLAMSRALLANLRVEHTDHSVVLRAEGIGTMADFASIAQAEWFAASHVDRDEGEASKGSTP